MPSHPDSAQSWGRPSFWASGPSPQALWAPRTLAPHGTGPGLAKTVLCPFLAFLATEHSGPQQPAAISDVTSKSDFPAPLPTQKGGQGGFIFPLRAPISENFLHLTPTPVPHGQERLGGETPIPTPRPGQRSFTKSLLQLCTRSGPGPSPAWRQSQPPNPPHTHPLAG